MLLLAHRMIEGSDVKRYILLFAVLGIFIVNLMPVGFSQTNPFQVKILADVKVVKPPESVKYTAIITNLEDTPLELEVLLSASQIAWYNVEPSYLRLAPHETKKVSITISPPEGTPSGLYQFIIIVRNKNNHAQKIEIKDTVYVEKSIKLVMKKLETSKQLYSMGEPITVMVGVKNEGSESTEGYNIYVVVEVEGITGKEVAKKRVPDLKVNETKLLTFNFTLDPYKAKGEYSVVAKLVDDIGDTLDEKRTSFTIESKAVMDKSKAVEKKFMEKEIIITVTNKGNEEGTFTIQEPKRYPDFAYIIITKPEIVEEDGSTYFVWECKLKPLESCTIRYGINYWPFLFMILAALIIFFIVFEVVQYPRVHKKHRRHEDIHKVYVTIRNRGKRTLKNVEVVDDVPGMFQVIREFEAGKPVEIKKLHGKTRIVWRFASLKPGEEKVLAYKIKPLLHVEGKIKLPPVEVRAQVGRRKIRTRSSEIMIE